MSTIRILSGSYRKQAVVNTEFTLVKGFQTGKGQKPVMTSYKPKNEGIREIIFKVLRESF